ncbi:hypothetical protein ACWGI0_24175 [Streptomyces sp. NPDC054802]
MANSTGILRAAWVPDHDDLDWEDAAQLAVDWVQRECDEQGASGLLVLNASGSQRSIPALSDFAARHAVTTPQSDNSGIYGAVGPVLAYVPDARTLDFATQLARGASLAVVESINGFRLAGWARELGAVDLTRPEDEPEPIAPSVAAAIKRLDFHKGNGFGDPIGKQTAQRALQGLQAQGLLDRETVLGALAARGASARAMKNLGILIDSMERH